MMTNPDRIAFSIGSIHVYWYGILMATGIIVAMLIAMREAKRKGLYQDAIVDMCLWAVPLGIVGARLYYVIFEWQNYAADPISALYIWEGGLGFYGSILGGVLGAWIFSRRKKIRLLTLIDCAAPGIALAQAIARWGNFFNQEAFGLPVTEAMMARSPLLQYFPFVVQIDGAHLFNGALCAEPYHLATFFYESVWCLIVFIILWTNRKKFKHDGDTFWVYAMLYALERFFIEGLRGDSLYILKPGTLGWLAGGIRVSQLLSAALIVALGAFSLVRASREKKLGRLIWPEPLPLAGAEDGENAEPTEDGESAQNAENIESTENGERAEDAENGKNADTQEEQKVDPQQAEPTEDKDTEKNTEE